MDQTGSEIPKKKCPCRHLQVLIKVIARREMLENLKKINTKHNVLRIDQAWKEIKQNQLHNHGECYSKETTSYTETREHNCKIIVPLLTFIQACESVNDDTEG
jgi:hypothetical protein